MGLSTRSDAARWTKTGTQQLPQYPTGNGGFTIFVMLIEYENVTLSSIGIPADFTLQQHVKVGGKSTVDLGFLHSVGRSNNEL